jgi:hypothetical protein
MYEWAREDGAVSQPGKQQPPKRMKEFKFECPHCQQRLQCDEELGGKQIQCPSCNVMIRVPISPDKQVEGHKTVQSGRTWDTFLPPKK